VGVHNAFDPANPYPDRRAQEYLPGHIAAASTSICASSPTRSSPGPPTSGARLHDHLRGRAERHMALSIADRGYVLQTGQMVLADTAQALLDSP